MGNYASKLLSYTSENRKECNDHQMVAQQKTTEDSSTCTPVLSGKRVLGDPRSISSGIRRTPIEVEYTPVWAIKDIPSAIPKYLQRKQYLETDMDIMMPPLTPKKRPIPRSMDGDQQSPTEDYSTPNANAAKDSKIITPIDKERFIILGLDPRSPAADFDRTPILMPKSLALIKARSQENLSRRGSYETDIYNLTNSHQETGTSFSIPEIRLSDTVSENFKSPLDMKEQAGPLIVSTPQYDSDLNISKSKKETTVIENSKCTNEKEKSLIADEWTVAIDNEEDKSEIKKQDDCKIIECNSTRKDDKIELWHDSLSSQENVSGKEDWEELSGEREDVITFDKYTTISTSLKLIKTKEDFRKKGDIKGKKKKNIKIFKPNEEKVFTLENKWGTEMHENRTPLGNRSNNGQMQKKPQQLLKSKATCTKMQQENTPPPCKTCNGKTRNGIQWDPNSTVLI